MTADLRIRREAERDVAEAARWYEAQRVGLGREFLDEVAACLRAVARQPGMFPEVHRGVRRALIRRFPFGVYYRAGTRRIDVIAVMHASRRPRRWQGG